jgi:nucleoid DNA-binding protein
MPNKIEMEKARKEIYQDIISKIHAATGHRITLKEAKSVFEASFKGAFTQAASIGKLRLPGGLGTLNLVQRKAIDIHTPYGEVVSVPDRNKFKYSFGLFHKKVLSGSTKED